MKATISDRPLAVTVGQAANLVNVSKWLIRDSVKLGKLRGVRLGKRLLIPMESLEQFAAGSRRK